MSVVILSDWVKESGRGVDLGMTGFVGYSDGYRYGGHGYG
jgi:hypothetical protein